jgi:hypothetical protein
VKRPPAIARALPSAAGSKGHADRNRDWAAGPTAAFIVTMLAALVLLTVLHAGLPGTTAPGPASWRATAGDFALPGSFSALPLNCLAGFGLGVASTPAVAYINGVRTGAHGQQDLVTIQFANKVPSQTSISAQIGATFTPRAGGKPVTLKGSYGAMVTMQTADGHSHYSGPSEINTGDRLVLELRKVRDDSGVVQWAIGLSEVPCFRTAYLDHPNRLVIDFVRGATTS